MRSNDTAADSGGSTRHAPRVVVGVSASESGRGALRFAVSEASVRHAALHIVRVWREVDGLFSMTAARAIGLRDRERADGLVLGEAVEAAHALDPEVQVIPEFVPGDLYAAMQARTEGAGLLVLGAGAGENNSLLIGEWFRQHAHCRVVLVAADGEIVRSGPSRPAGISTCRARSAGARRDAWAASATPG